MATSAYASTSETTNANRTSRVLLGPCSDQLRDILLRYVPPVNFPHVIRHKQPNLPRLTTPQRDLILPRTGHYSGNYSDMDISLLYLLLRNICNIQPHMNGWGNSPNVSDHSLAASIERIREARNRVGHASCTSLPGSDFTHIWSNIKDAVKSMDAFLNNGNKYENAMDFLLTETMDPEQEDFYIDLLRKQCEEDTRTRESVRRFKESVNGKIQDIQTNQQEIQRQQRDQQGGIQELRSQQQELQRQQTDQQGGIQELRSQQQEIQRQQTDQQGGIEELRSQQQELHRQQTDQQGGIQELRSQQQEIQRQQTDQQEGIQELRSQQQELQRQQTDQQGGIEELRYQQQEIQRQQTDQQGGIEELRSQQQEIQRQQTDQQGGIQELRYQQQEIQRQQTDQQGGIQELRSQQQEIQRQQTDQQGGIQELRSQQQEIQRQQTDQYTTHSTQIAELAHRIPRTHVMQDEEPDVNRLKERLVEINDPEIPLTPLQEDGDKLPVEQLFASVVIKEETRKGRKSAQSGKEQERKEVKTPEDMLTKNGLPVRRVYMLGDAAHGKTTYCTWLHKMWCNAQKPGMIGRLNEWENALGQFDFVFHLKFRHVDPTRANVIDMICQDILGEDTGLHTAAKHVLSSDKYRCLIIMDGLDEWKPDQSAIPQLKYKAMPNIDNMSNCVIFTTMRPWMSADVAGLVRDDDRVIEIQGLDDKGIEDVIEKVLVHYYEMKPHSDEYRAKCNEIISKLKDKTLKSFLHIPLLAVVCIQIWCEGEQVGDGLTSFYVAMVNMLIERAKMKNQIPKLSLDTTNLSLPRILSAKKNIKCFSNVLLKLGKVAYEGLISKQMKLVFQKDDLESEIGERELKFALDVGLISQTEAPSITTRKVNVHFFHKSVQEFLAVIYIVTQKKVSDNFCTHLCNVKVIMELSNVIMFICGMCPSLGSVISQIVVSVADSDGEICKYRESPGHNNTVIELYKLQVSWYRESQYGQTDSQVTFHVSDVFLAVNSDTETVRVTRELLSGHHDIRSLTLLWVPTDGERGITDTELGDFLSNTDKTRSLITLCIYGDTGRSVHTLCGPSLRTLSLWRVTIQDRDSVRPVITQTDRLQRLVLIDVSLGDRGLGLTPHMTDLQEVDLYRVRMTQSGWGRLIQSVIDIHHQFVVILRDTDIDSDSVSTLHSSPHISVTRDDDDKYGGRDIKFTRVWPLTQDTQ